jgi:hypothetical protein
MLTFCAQPVRLKQRAAHLFRSPAVVNVRALVPAEPESLVGSPSQAPSDGGMLVCPKYRENAR